jgi:hypothetical protein
LPFFAAAAILSVLRELFRLLIIAGYGPILRRRVLAKIKKNLVPVAPAPAFGRIVALIMG